jgi:hypothetical protein
MNKFKRFKDKKYLKEMEKLVQPMLKDFINGYIQNRWFICNHCYQAYSQPMPCERCGNHTFITAKQDTKMLMSVG